MRSLVLVAAIYAALTASFVGSAERARPTPAAQGVAPAGSSQRLSAGRLLWLPAGTQAPAPTRLEQRRFTPAVVVARRPATAVPAH